MKFTTNNVNGTASSASKIPVETALEKGYLTLAELTEIVSASLWFSGSNPNSILAVSGTFEDDLSASITFPALWKDASLIPDRIWVDKDHLALVPDYGIYHNGTDWQMLCISGPLFSAPGAPDADLATLVWANIGGATGADTVAITGEQVGAVATHLGQWCKVTGTSVDSWWQWNGTTWIPRFTDNGQSIFYNATLSAYRKQTLTGADDSETVTFSDL